MQSVICDVQIYVCGILGANFISWSMELIWILVIWRLQVLTKMLRVCSLFITASATEYELILVFALLFMF